MIVPMKKVSFVILEKDRKNALKTLRKTGVVHVEEVKGESEELKYKKIIHICSEKLRQLKVANIQKENNK